MPHAFARQLQFTSSTIANTATHSQACTGIMMPPQLSSCACVLHVGLPAVSQLLTRESVDVLLEEDVDGCRDILTSDRRYSIVN
jgi:hypothetical protein